MTKNIKLNKIKTLKQKNDMELIRNNNMKTMRRKKSQTMVKDTELKDKAKGSIEGGEKKFLGPHI